MSSYEELDPEMKKQVDATLWNVKYNLSLSLTEDQQDYLREHISNCVMTCVGIATEKPKRTIPINRGHGKRYY